MKKIILLFSILLYSISIYSQIDYEWNTLPNSPNVGSRINDAYFIDPQTGWVVNGYGQIYKTSDGGENWVKQFDRNRLTHFRSVGFVDELNGFAGAVGAGEFNTTDTTVIYKTTNGGTSWSPWSAFSGPKPAGLCGMHVLNDSIITAVGRVRGPAFFVRTTDGGKTWTSKSMQQYAAGLIDVYFFSPDSGIAAGLSNSTHSQSRGVVLFTSDGGETWEKKFTTSRDGEWIWKVNFPSRQVGYASLQRNSGSPVNFLKTTDGGNTWVEKQFFSTNYFVQGIGFYNENLGWIGGNSSYTSYETTDGGNTWHPANFGSRLNRVRMINDTVGYGVGDRVYKFTVDSKTLPVELISFLGEQTDGKVNLLWKTASEKNNHGFEVQRKILSSASTDFVTIGFVNGAGTTTESQSYSYSDDIIDLNQSSLSYRLKQIDFDGSFTFSDEILINNISPKEFVLNQNYPNPFNPSTTISFEIISPGMVDLKIYDLLGNETAVLLHEEKEAGRYEINFDASKPPAGGHGLSSGVYFYKLTSGNQSAVKKLTVLK